MIPVVIGPPPHHHAVRADSIGPMSATARPLRVVLVDDHPMVLLGLREMLRPFAADVEVVGSSRSFDAARMLISSTSVDIVLTDVRIGRDIGVDLVRSLATSHPLIRVVMLTDHEEEHFLFQSLRAGAKGYLSKCVDGYELVAHLRRIFHGDVVVDPVLAGRVALSAARTIGRNRYWPGARRGLTQRESEVLNLLVAGDSNKDIAAQLVISEDTVKTHTRSLYRKLDVKDRAAATATALREGLSE